MHLGLLSLVEDLIPTPMKTSARFSRKQTGESIPSIERMSNRLRRSATAHVKR
jgi:hypothetical protein